MRINPDRLNKLCSAYIPVIQIGIILFLGIVSYANTLDVPLQIDDKSTIRVSFSLNTDLYSVREFFRKGRWFADITFALNRLLHGEQVFGYHLVNLVIHLLTAGVMYLFLQQATEALKKSFSISGSDEQYAFLQRFIPFTAAALFVCHPVQTQAVTYISQRYTSLATLLYLGSLLSYLMARLALSDRTQKLYVWLWGFACVFLALLAMKSKEIAFTLPLMIVALEYTIFRGQLLKNRLLLALCAVLILVIPLQLIYSKSSMSPESMLNQMQLATAETQNISRTDYLLTQFRVVATYLRLLVLPINQNWDYDYPLYHSLFNTQILSALLLHITLLGIALFLFIRSERQSASCKPVAGITLRLASLGIFWFYLALSVESSLIPIRDVIFEHRIYLPSVGFFMAVAAGVSGVVACRRQYRNALWVSIILLCLALTTGTIYRNRIWSDEMILWQDVLKKSPKKARANLAVGTLYIRRYMPEKALPYLVRAVELEPGRDFHWISLSSAIQLTDRYEGRYAEGSKYQATIETINPLYRIKWLATGSNNLGLAYEYLGNQYLARESYLKASSFDTSLDLAWYNLALVAARLNDTATVASALQKLESINPLLEKAAVKAILKLRKM